jgi:DNA-3-methyladenine glycosylase I
MTNRCAWAKNELSIPYHDQEWGVPVHDDRLLFEFLVLEGAQAGLSWDTILRKRARYREVFDNLDPALVARYGKRKVSALLRDAGIVRNRLKIAAAIGNAQAFLKVAEEFGSFDAYIWQFTESDAMSKDLKRRGFRFVGSTICYAFMQAVGVVNDHATDCFRYTQLLR